MTNAADVADTADREIVVKRIFDAPREAVYDAFFDHANISKWWGPHGFSTTTHSSDVRVGGVWSFTMHGPDGTDYPNRVVYTKLDRPNGFAHDHGKSEAEPHLFYAFATLVDLGGGKTELTWRMVLDTPEARDAMIAFGAVQGAEQTLSRLADLLASRN